jgi:hypothetical protein
MKFASQLDELHSKFSEMLLEIRASSTKLDRVVGSTASLRSMVTIIAVACVLAIGAVALLAYIVVNSLVWTSELPSLGEQAALAMILVVAA